MKATRSRNLLVYETFISAARLSGRLRDMDVLARAIGSYANSKAQVKSLMTGALRCTARTSTCPRQIPEIAHHFAKERVQQRGPPTVTSPCQPGVPGIDD